MATILAIEGAREYVLALAEKSGDPARAEEMRELFDRLDSERATKMESKRRADA